jgi:hypothetical protein
VVTLEGLERKLLLGLDAHLPQLGNFLCEDGFGRGGRVDTVGLDGDDNTTTDLEEETSCDTLAVKLKREEMGRHTIQANNTGLIGLRNIGEDAINHADEHAVLERVTSVLDNWDDVCAVRGHVDQITSRAVGKLDSEDGSLGSNDISDVRHGGTGRGTEIKDLGSRAHVDVVDTTEDTSSQLGSEGVPDAVFDAAWCGVLASVRVLGGADADALLAVDALAGGQVLGDEEIFLSAGDEDTSVTMGLNNDLAAELLDFEGLIRWERTYAPPRAPPRPPRAPPRGAPRPPRGAPRPPPRPPRSPNPPRPPPRPPRSPPKPPRPPRGVNPPRPPRSPPPNPPRPPPPPRPPLLRCQYRSSLARLRESDARSCARSSRGKSSSV